MVLFPFNGLRRAAMAAALAAAAAVAQAGPLTADLFGQFSFSDAGSLAAGCDPADPAGAFCAPSTGTATVLLDAPAWTFVAGSGGAVLTVVDVFEATDRFEVLDFGVPIGSTSALAPFNVLPDCGDDPAVCLQTAGMSVGQFLLGAGAHEITLRVLQSGGLGTGYLRVQDLGGAVPEPGSGWLLLAALGAARAARRASRRGVVA